MAKEKRESDLQKIISKKQEYKKKHVGRPT